MKKSSKALILLVLAAPGLAGCQSLFGKSYSGSDIRVAPAIGDADEYGASQLAIGKEALDAGQYGLAIVAFRNAKQAPDHVAAAYNGLAVAYLQLGRADLAERFFKLAIAEAPGEKRYQANLTRFYSEVPAVAVSTVREPATELAVAEPPQPAALGAVMLGGNAAHSGITVTRPTDRLVRVSASEVAIRAAPAGVTDPRRRVQTAAAAQAAQGRRINPNYPVKFSITAATAPAFTAPRYPVRIGFAAAERASSPVAPAASRIRVGVTGQR